MHKELGLRIGFIIAVGIIVLVVVAAVYENITAPSIDCIRHASSRLNIVLDRTKPYSDIQKLNLDKSVGDIIRSALGNAQINVFFMTDDGDRPRTVLSICRPNNENALTGDPEESTYELQRKVIDTIRRVVDLPLRDTKRHPIIETLDTLSREKLVSAENGPNNMFMFSDMVQDSENGSLRGCAGNLPRLAELDPYTEKVSDFYQDIPFSVFVLVRGSANKKRIPSERCVRLFWEHALPDIKSWEPL